MGHEHNHAPANYGRAFAAVIILNLGFVILEVIYGRLSNSLEAVAAIAAGLIAGSVALIGFGFDSIYCQGKSGALRGKICRNTGYH